MIRRLFIANRGEIAIRIARAANDANIAAVGCYAQDDAGSLHVARAEAAIALPGAGARAYLDSQALIEAALGAKCDALHPGYGFLSESAAFARACAEAGLDFVGPSPETLDLFGDKAKARALAERAGVPLLQGTNAATSLAEAERFFAELDPGGAMMIKAVAGGGGRGMRIVSAREDLGGAFERCRSEALAAFGSADLYVERLVPRARHIEIQTIGDGRSVMPLGERDCTLQRRHQKLVEIAPSPWLDAELRARIVEAARRLAHEAGLVSLCTFEFLVDLDAPAETAFAFIEANPRLQVEHTITEEIFGVDLVRAQIEIAGGARLADLGFNAKRPPRPGGFAIQMRVNAETVGADGVVRPSLGTIAAFEPPSGPGVRVDAGVCAGSEINPNYDSLIAKIIVHSPSENFGVALRRARRALADARIDGIETNVDFLRALMATSEVETSDVDTRFVERFASSSPWTAGPRPAKDSSPQTDTVPPLHGIFRRPGAGAPGAVPICAPIGGRVVAITAAEGKTIGPGAQVAIIESMKMEHLATTERGGTVLRILADVGAVVREGAPLLLIDPADVEAVDDKPQTAVDPDAIRPDLAEFFERIALARDESRPAAVAKRRAKGQRTARENIADLFDADSFVEYGALAVAAQRRRRKVEDLIANTPADGVITGFGTINAASFGAEAARAAVVAYDFTVLAGTQGHFSHKKTDRLLELAAQWRAPTIVYAEGGGGRPGDTDSPGVAGLDVKTFATFARLSGIAPLVGVVAGRCFAGNAALLGCCDVIIATKDSNIGMSGPAMIEGGGLGVFRPEDIGPIEVQTANGVVDIAVADEAEATRVAKTYLGYFQGRLPAWTVDNQRKLRNLMPENRARAYPVRAIIQTLCDTDSVLEMRRAYGRAIVTAFARVEGRPIGILASDPTHLGGAIDGDASDKAARFMRLCDFYGLPIISLIDTPGFMVGPDVEARAQVRRACRMFLAGSRVTTPFISIVLRRGYGLGAQAMAAGSFHAPAAILSWPSGEFGGMGIEGAVRLGYKKEMDAIEDPAAREAYFSEAVARMRAHGKALNMAMHLEIDAVIDPADTRAQILRLVGMLPARRNGEVPPAPFLDSW